jgi:D-glycero-D-manno-heptose 1,7-bisphosphate phosphatase
LFKKKVLILDRDGTINAKTSDYYVYQEENFKIFDDAKQFISQAIKLGFHLAVATNQRGISRGIYSLDEVFFLHNLLCEAININSAEIPLFVCPHDIGVCNCRKPNPGMILDILDYYSALPSDALFIGNSESDYIAATSCNVDFIHIIRDEKDYFSVKVRDLTSVKALTDLFPELVSR